MEADGGGQLMRKSHAQRDEEGMTAVIEFLTAFVLFLMIVTAFLSLAQLTLGPYDSTTDIFLEHFEFENLDHLPNKDELKASGFLEKKSAIATISDLASNNEELINHDEEENDDDNLDDFIPNIRE